MNKRLLFILPLFLMSISGFAQLQKGNKLLGGTISYSSSKNNSDNSGVAGGLTDKTNRFSLSPLIGVFVSDKTVIGLKFDYFSSKSENTPITGQANYFENDRFGFGPFARRYFPIKEWVAFYGQAELNYNSSKYFQSYNTNSTIETKSKSVNFIASLGLSFFPVKWMSVDLSANPLSFYHQRNQSSFGNSSSSDANTNGFNLNLNSNSFFLGAHFFLNKK